MKYLKVFTDFADAVSELGDAEIGRLFMAMMKYAATNELSELRGNERFVWPTAKMNIDREIDYCAQQRENGKLGGRPKSHGNPNKANESRKSQKDKDKDKDKDITTPSISPLDDISENARKAFACFMEMRVKMKKPMTGEAVRLAVNKLKGMATDEATQIAIINQSIERCWLSFFPLKDEQKRTDKPAKRAHNHSTRNYTPEELGAIGRDLLEDV